MLNSRDTDNIGEEIRISMKRMNNMDSIINWEENEFK
jgi:hypothetical protein